MATYLVTGGAGFIGSNIAEELLACGEKVRIFDDLSTGKRENLASFEDKVELIIGDLSKIDEVRPAVEGVDYVLHQGRPSVGTSLRQGSYQKQRSERRRHTQSARGLSRCGCQAPGDGVVVVCLRQYAAAPQG